MADPRAQVVLDGDVGPLRQKLREAAQHMQAFGRDAGAGMGGLNSQADALRSMLASLAGALSVAAFTSFVKTQIDTADAMSKAAQKAGVTTEQFSGMAYAAKLADVEAEQLTKTYAKLGALLTDALQGQKDAVETFQRLKLDPKNFKDADELLLAIAERFATMKDGAAKTTLAVDLFGERLGPGLIPMLNSGRSGIEELRQEAQRLGVVIDTEAGKRAEEFNDTLTKMKAAAQGVGMTFAKELLPALQVVSSELLKARTQGGSAFEGLAKIISGAFNFVVIVLADVSNEIGKIGMKVGAVAAHIANVFSGEGWVGRTKNISQALKEDLAQADRDFADFKKRILEGGSAAPVGGGAERSSPFSTAPKAPPEQKAPGSLMQYYELALAEEKRLAAERDATREYSKAEELAYWEWLLQSTLIHGNDRVAMERKVAQLTVEVRRKAAQESLAVSAELVRNAEALELGAVEAKRAAAGAALDLGLITKEQFLQQELGFEKQRFEITRQGVMDRIRLAMDDPNTSPVERERLNSRLLELEQQYQTRRTAMLGQLNAEKGSGVNNVATSFGSTFGDELEKVLLRTQTWKQAMGNIFRETGLTFVREIITKPLANYVASLARMLAIKLGFLTQEEAAQVISSGKVVGTKVKEATGVATANAVEAGTGAAGAVAPTPWVGPVLALAAMAAVFAAVSGMTGRLKSARGGYDIPSGVNPMAQLHEEEMVLPARLSNVIRGLADDTSTRGRGNEGTIHIHGRPDDTIKLRDLPAILKKMNRDGAFPVRVDW